MVVTRGCGHHREPPQQALEADDPGGDAGVGGGGVERGATLRAHEGGQEQHPGAHQPPEQQNAPGLGEGIQHVWENLKEMWTQVPKSGKKSKPVNKDHCISKMLLCKDSVTMVSQNPLIAFQ